MLTKCAVFVNLEANNGRAAQRWENIEAEVLALLPKDVHVVTFRPPTDIEPIVKALLTEGFRTFISAGGDGSAHFLLNILMRHTGEDARHVSFGGIGLGSSNDFIKPKTHFIKDLPTRLDFKNAMLVDVGKAEFLSPSGEWQTHYFIANASLGVTAEANWLFNHGDWFIRLTKNRWTNLAILYAALRTIFGFRNFMATMVYDGKTRETKLSNLAILKSTYVSGSFYYDDPVRRDDGFLGINACLDMKKTELVGILLNLAKGRFRGEPKTLSVAIRKLRVFLQSSAAFEMDGEVFQAKEVIFSVLPKSVNLLGL